MEAGLRGLGPILTCRVLSKRLPLAELLPADNMSPAPGINRPLSMEKKPVFLKYKIDSVITDNSPVGPDLLHSQYV